MKVPARLLATAAQAEEYRRLSENPPRPPYHYIVVREMNQRGPQAAQVAHAAGESMALAAANMPSGVADVWDPASVYVVILVAKDGDALAALAANLETAGIDHVVIREPDPPFNGTATAIGICPTRDRDRLRPYVEGFKVLR